jgi:hypothetical protein
MLISHLSAFSLSMAVMDTSLARRGRQTRFYCPVLKLRRILRKNYLQNSIFTQKPSLPPTTNLDSQQYTYHHKQARHNRITRFDFLLIPLLPQIQPKQHIRHHFRKNPGVVRDTSFEEPQQKTFTNWQPRT